MSAMLTLNNWPLQEPPARVRFALEPRRQKKQPALVIVSVRNNNYVVSGPEKLVRVQDRYVLQSMLWHSEPSADEGGTSRVTHTAASYTCICRSGVRRKRGEGEGALLATRGRQNKLTA